MPVETKPLVKRWVYFCVLICGGIMGNMLSCCVYNGRKRNLVGVGASTSICAVIGFDIAFRVLRVDGRPLQARRIYITLFYLFLISMLPGVDFYGHFGSLIGGFWIGLAGLEAGENWGTYRQRLMLRVVGAVLLVVYVGVMIGLIVKYQQ